MRVECNTPEFKQSQIELLWIIFYLRFIPAKLSRIAKQHPSNTPSNPEVGSPPETTCAGFVDMCLPILHSY
jgi:hypothetical protein